MRPALWQPPVECSPAEQKIITRIRRAKLFVFLRQYRHEIFDEVFQAELAQGYADQPARSTADTASPIGAGHDSASLYRRVGR